MMELANRKGVLVMQPGVVRSYRGVDGVNVVGSPLALLKEAASGRYRWCFLFLEWQNNKEREALLELCAALRQMTAAQAATVVCVLPARHREMLGALKEAGVRFVAFASEGANLAGLLAKLPAPPSAGMAIEAVLAEICPHLHHQPLDGGKELATCGAYRDRLVLSRERMRGHCRQATHQDCEYYLARRQDKPGQEEPSPCWSKPWRSSVSRN